MKNDKAAKSGKLEIRDLITIGVFGSIIFGITLVTSMIAGVTALSYLFIACGMGLFSAPIYFLATARSNKRFVSLLIWLVNGILWAIVGGYPVLAGMALSGVISEFILWKNGYRSFWRLTAAYCIGVLGYHLGAFSLLYLFTDQYIEKMSDLSSSLPADYVQTLVSAAKGWIGIAVLAIVIFCSLISSLVAGRILKKHFIKAGIV